MILMGHSDIGQQLDKVRDGDATIECSYMGKVWEVF